MSIQTYRLKKADGYYVKMVDVFVGKEETAKKPGHVAMIKHGFNSAIEVPEGDLIPSEVPHTQRPGWAYMDDDEFFPCRYDPNERWNGFYVPKFDKDTFEAILATWACQIRRVPAPEPSEHPYEDYALFQADEDPDEMPSEEWQDRIAVVLNLDTGRYEFAGHCWHCCANAKEVARDDDRVYNPMLTNITAHAVLNSFKKSNLQDYSLKEIYRCLKLSPDHCNERDTARLVQEALFRGELTYVPE